MEPSELFERAHYVTGLRELAAFIEAHPALPMPVPSILVNAFVYHKDDLAALARLGSWEKGAIGNYFFLRKVFAGDVRYEINVARERVCRKVVTGTRVEPAQPEQVVQDFYWVCDEPLLKGIDAAPEEAIASANTRVSEGV